MRVEREEVSRFGWGSSVEEVGGGMGVGEGKRRMEAVERKGWRAFVVEGGPGERGGGRGEYVWRD